MSEEMEQYNKDAGGMEGPFYVMRARYEPGNDTDAIKEIVYGPDTQINCGGWIVQNSQFHPDCAMAVVPADYAIGYPKAKDQEKEFEEVTEEKPPVIECDQCGWIGAREKCPVIESMVRCIACNSPLENA